jgi:fucose 4-O-acetylase-like acetyltransferase
VRHHIGVARLAFLDNLKTVLVILVIAHHAGQPYGPTGGRWPLTHAVHERMLGPFFHVNASFFMGLFFLISAYFLPISYDRKGPKRFLLDRIIRLGAVLLFFQFLVFPAAGWALASDGLSFGAYWMREIVERKHIEFGHLWFLSHLLVYAVGYAAWRKLRGPLPEALRRQARPFPSNLAIALYAAALAAVSAVVRIWFPIDRWVFIGVPSELAHLPQYFSLFVLGVLAYRYGWMPEIPDRAGKPWLGIGLALAAWRYSYTAFRWSWLRRGGQGPDWQALVWNAWEAFLAVGLCIGAVWFFRRCWPDAGAVARFCSRNAYGVYLVHLPLVVAAQVALIGTGYSPLALTVLSTVMATAASYAVIALLRLAPGSDRFL